MSKTNYAYKTSLPAYQENPSQKATQCEQVKRLIQSGHRCLKQLEEATGLPQSTVAGRVNDLVSSGEVEYNGEVIYAGRKRKKIAIVQKEMGEQAKLF